MSASKNTKFNQTFGVIVGILALGLGALTYLGFSKVSENAAADEASADKLKSLNGKPLFPSEENVEKKKKRVAEFTAKVNDLQKKLRGYQRPLNTSLDGGSFGQNLQKRVETVKQLAEQKGVTYPEGFALGFREYVSKAPPAIAMPELDYQMEALQFLVTQMINARIDSIDSITRIKMPKELDNYGQEEAQPATKRSSSRKSSKDKKTAQSDVEKPPAIPEKDVLTRYPVEMEVTASEKVLSEILHTLGNSPPNYAFVVPRYLTIENMMKQGPEKSGAAKIEAGGEKDPDIDSQMILGSEKLKAKITFDVVRFNQPDSGALAKK